MDSLGTIKLGDFLGEGAYGIVNKIKIEGKDMAYKHIRSCSMLGINQIGELNFLRTIDHPNLLHCDKFVVNTDGLGLILPFALGNIKHVKENHSCYFDLHFNNWVYEMLSAIHFLHKKGFYHCDIKPGNILIINAKAVVSDFGLMGEISFKTPAVCQTFKSPQFYVRELPRTRSTKTMIMSLSKKTVDILTAPSTIIQDDIWALGYTIYDLIVIDNNILYLDANIKYITDPDKILNKDLSDAKSKPFIPLLKKLMAPNPKDREFNLEDTLVLYPMNSRYAHFVDGAENIYNVNANSVIFNDKVTLIFKKLITKIREWFVKLKKTAGFKGGLVPVYVSIDLLYRIFSHFIIDVKKSCKEILSYIYIYCIACVQIACVVNNIDIYVGELEELEDEEYINGEDIVKAEIDIIQKMDGILVRNSVYRYLNDGELEKGLNWINNNPHEYEKKSPEMLAKFIRTL